jgi:division protein CdvB (Snf7/Vps24/ESCRT-III family)
MIINKNIAYKHYKKSPHCKIAIQTIDKTISDDKFMYNIKTEYDRKIMIEKSKLYNDFKRLESEFETNMTKLESDFSSALFTDNESYNLMKSHKKIKALFYDLKIQSNSNVDTC